MSKVVLCEGCFPDWGNHEVHTIVPMTPCVQCGAIDYRMSGGNEVGDHLRTHLFTGDPRERVGVKAEVR